MVLFDERQSISDEIVEHIQKQISTGELSPGEKLPSQEELSEKLNVSRATLRESLQKLRMVGLIKVQHGKGSFVSENPTKNFIDNVPFPGLLFKQEDYLQLLEARKYIEGNLATLAAKRAKNSNISSFKHLKKLVKDMESAVKEDDADRFSEKDLSFHLQIAELAENRFLDNMLQLIRHLIHEQQRKINSLDGVMEQSMKYHEKILEAFIQRNGAVGEIMQNHIENVMESYQRKIIDN